MATFMKCNILPSPPSPPPFYLRRFLRGQDVKEYSFYCDDLSQYVSAQMVLTMSNWSHSINFSLLLLTVMLLCTRCCFCINSWVAVAFCQGKPDFSIRRSWVHECWESVYNILPSAALLYVDTCFKMWCISLYLPVLNTLCSSSS